MSAQRLYSRAMRAMQPSKAHADAMRVEHNAAANAARDAVRAQLAAGADPRALYQAETDKERRVILVGVLRRGLSALDHT